MKRAIEEGLALAAAAGLGLAAMYLFDPDQGKNRRQTIRSAAHRTIQSAEESIGELRDRITKHGKAAAESVSDKVTEMLPHQSSCAASSKIAAAAGTGVALFSIGAGLAYLFDPDRGRSRRAYLRDHAHSLFNSGNRWAKGKGHHLTNKARGIYAQTQAKLHPEKTAKPAAATAPH